MNKTDVDAVILDLMLPDLDGFEICRRLKSDPDQQMIPVIMVTALDDAESRLSGIEAGADDFLTKPVDRAELLARVRSAVRMRRLNRTSTSIEKVLFALANAVESIDSYTHGHTERVANLAVALGRRMGLMESDVTAIRFGGILHDIGKIAVPGEILNKAGSLTEEEWVIMKRHTEVGYRICLPLAESIGDALDIIRHHHEKLDGSSYPDGLKGSDISLSARIMGVVDIYDALTTHRPYREAMDQATALDLLDEEAKKHRIDPGVVLSLREMLGAEKGHDRRRSDKQEHGPELQE